MEYDNDRIIKGTYRAEVFCWTFVAMLYPILSSLIAVGPNKYLWPVLLGVNILVLPVYITYSRLIVPRFLFKNQYGVFGVWTALFFVLMQALIFLFFKIAFWISAPAVENYFTYNGNSFSRESAWIFLNGCFAVGIAWMRKQLSNQEQMELLKKEHSFYKLRYFRTQLNPHFLFNTLNSIYSLSLNKADKTPEVIVKLSDIMRFLIYECDEEKIPLRKEIDFILNYIEIEKIRYDADIQLSVEGDIDNIHIEPFLFISFVENAFKHAIDHSFARPFIYITIKASKEQIVLNVINNTSSELETQAKKITGKGLQTSKNVLDLLYPRSYALDIIQTEKEERKVSKLRMKNAQERLESLYPDTHTLDVILNNSSFTVSLILNLLGPVKKANAV